LGVHFPFFNQGKEFQVTMVNVKDFQTLGALVRGLGFSASSISAGENVKENFRRKKYSAS
jgi:hypothetical protein